jgi:hypothetical protein
LLVRERDHIKLQIYLLDTQDRGSTETGQGAELDPEETKLFTLPNTLIYFGKE